MLLNLPNELIIDILQVLCTEIYDSLHIRKPVDRSRLPLTGVPTGPRFGKNLRPYRDLLLVCRQFRRLLQLGVYVDGGLIRKRLAQLQLQKFECFLENKEYIDQLREHHTTHLIEYPGWAGPSLTEIESVCGLVCNNPLFPTLLRQVLAYGHVVSHESLHWFRYLLPMYKLNISNTLEQNTMHFIDDVRNLVHKGLYQIGRPEGRYIEFVAGKYRIPHLLGPNEDYICVSILSFFTQTRYGGKVELKGEEGRYWLWLSTYIDQPNVQCKDFWVADYRDSQMITEDQFGTHIGWRQLDKYCLPYWVDNFYNERMEKR